MKLVKRNDRVRVIIFMGIIPFNLILDTENNFANFSMALITGSFSVQ